MPQTAPQTHAPHNPLRAARVREAIAALPRHDPRVDRLLDIAFRLVRRKHGSPPYPMVPHWRISVRGGTSEVVRGRDGAQATRRLMRRLDHVDWTGYGCPVYGVPSPLAL